MPFLLSFYQRVASLLEKAVRAWIYYRLWKGREDSLRIKERFGIASMPRPLGKVVWFHGASVGETVSLLPLLKRFRTHFPDLTPLITTGTVSAAKVLAKVLPQGCIHQYCPADVPQWVKAFLDHWQPEMAVFAESEFWPNLLLGCQYRHIPLYMVNGDLSAKSCRVWQRLPAVIKYLLSCFEELLVQSGTVASRLKCLGAYPDKITVCGNLKFSAAPLTYDKTQLRMLKSAFQDRLIWVATSTHPGEEELIARAHQQIKKKIPSVLTVIIPRHPYRSKKIAASLNQMGLEVVERSREKKILSSTDIYLVDSLGELGLFYQLSDIAFIGGTFVSIGGHNPIEPVLLNCTPVWGPQIHNFKEVCQILEPGGTGVASWEELAGAVQELLQDPTLREQKILEGNHIVAAQAAVADNVFERLRKTL